MRGSTTICHSAAATDGSSPSLEGKTAFLGNNRGVNWGSACLGDSGRGTSAEQSVSSDVANARNRGSEYDQSAVCRSGLAEFTKSYYRGDADYGSDHDEFGDCRSGLAKFTKSYYRGDADCGSNYDKFVAR